VSCDIGIDIGGTNIKLGLVDAQGSVVARRRLDTRAGLGPKRAMVRLGAAIEELRALKRVRSVGVGIAGLVDHEHGVVRVPPNLPGWHGFGVKRALEDMTGLPVWCSNDANAVCLGEWLHGAGRGCDNLFSLTLGTGCGGGAIVNGRLLLGANHAAGELGHTVIQADGPECRCGGKGCLERYVGAKYVIQRAKQAARRQARRIRVHRNQMSFLGDAAHDRLTMLFELAGPRLSKLDARLLGIAARKGDRVANEVVEETGYYLGLGIVNVVALLDPERVVIGGGVSGLGRPLLRSVRKTVLSRGQIFTGRKLDIVFGELGNDAGIVGAARLGRWLRRRV